MMVAMLAGGLRRAPDAALRRMGPTSAACCLALVVVAWLCRVLSMEGVSAQGL